MHAVGATDPRPSVNPGPSLVSLELAVAAFERCCAAELVVTHWIWARAYERLAARQPAGTALEPTPRNCQWLWQTLLSMPGFREHARKYLQTSVTVVPRPAEFVIMLNAPELDRHLASSFVLSFGRQIRQLVLVRTHGPLVLEEGKNGKLACVPVPCDVWIPVENARPADIEKAGIGRELVAIHPHALQVRVHSLNEAYIAASRRLEEARQAHGGSIYGHMGWTDRGTFVTLAAIRDAAMRGRSTWDGLFPFAGLPSSPIHGPSGAPGYDDPPWPCRRDGTVDLAAWSRFLRT